MTKEDFLNEIEIIFREYIESNKIELSTSDVNYSQRYSGWEYMFKEFFVTYNLQMGKWSVYPLSNSSLGFGIADELEEAWDIANSQEGLENLLYKPDKLNWKLKLVNYVIDNRLEIIILGTITLALIFLLLFISLTWL